MAATQASSLPLAKKLQLKEPMRGRILMAPAGLDLGLEASADGPWDWVLAFVVTRADLAAVSPQLMTDLREDGLVWIAYPKKTSRLAADLDRDHGWEPVAALGLKGVRQIAIDDDWSALRFRETRFVPVRSSPAP
jgi:hypothetical protein